MTSFNLPPGVSVADIERQQGEEPAAPLRPSDIVQWIGDCVGNVEAGFYQEFESVDSAWYVNGAPTLFSGNRENELIAVDASGAEFRIIITRKRK